MRLVHMLAVLAVVLSVAGLALLGSHAMNGRASSRASSISPSSYPRWPADTLSDWAGFADQLSVATITGERELPPDAQASVTGEGLVGRLVTAHIHRTLWTRPGAPTTAEDVDLSVDGWVVHEGVSVPIVLEGVHRLEVGDRAVLALTKTPEGVWSLLSAGSVIPLVGANRSVERATDRAPLDLRGKTISQIRAVLEASRPTAIAAKYQHLDPDARAQAVWMEMLAVP